MQVKGQLEDAQAEVLASAPTDRDGRFYYDRTIKRLSYYDETSWQVLNPAALGVGEVYNLGMSLAAGTFKITQASQSVLSASGYALIGVPSTTEGKVVVLKANSDTHLFVDAAGSSDIIGEEFGTDAGEAWGSVGSNYRPFYVYAVNKDDTDANLKFMISPDPTLAVTPSSANSIGYHATPATSTLDTNVFFLTDTLTPADWLSKPCVLVGGIRMTKDGSDDWTIEPISRQEGDGIRRDPFITKVFSMVAGQMGATATANTTNDYLTGVTVPTWATASSVTYKYRIALDGTLEIMYDTTAAGNASGGAGADAVSLVLPYDPAVIPAAGLRVPVGFGFIAGAAVPNLMLQFKTATNKEAELYNSNTAILANTFSNTADDSRIYARVQVFGEL